MPFELEGAATGRVFIGATVAVPFRLLEQSVRIEGRGPSCSGGSAEGKGGPARATQTAAASKPKTEPRHAGSNEDCECCKPTAISDLLNGAAPTVPFRGFDSRFGVYPRIRAVIDSVKMERHVPMIGRRRKLCPVPPRCGVRTVRWNRLVCELLADLIRSNPRNFCKFIP